MVDVLNHNPDANFTEVEPIKPVEQETGMDQRANPMVTPEQAARANLGWQNNLTQEAQGPDNRPEMQPGAPELQRQINMDLINQAGPMLQVTAHQLQDATINDPSVSDGLGLIMGNTIESVRGIRDALENQPTPQVAMNGPTPPALAPITPAFG